MTVFVPEVTEVVLEVHEPPKVTVPASEDEIIKSGVLSFVGCVTSHPPIDGAVVSITNELIFNVTLLLELSVTVIVQSE